jgi:hypothetical protein
LLQAMLQAMPLLSNARIPFIPFEAGW